MKVATEYLGDVMQPLADEASAYQPTAEELDRVAGVYYSSRTEQTVRIERREGGLVLALWSGIPMIPVAPNRFRLRTAPTVFEYAPPTNGRPATITMLSGAGKANVLEAVVPVFPGPAELAEYAGTFRSTELGVSYGVVLRDGKLALVHHKLGIVLLSPTLADHFALENGDLTFVRGGAGPVSGFRLDSGRTRHLWFARDW